MDKDLSIKKSITIDASKDKVWGALTDPQKIKQYFFNVEVDSDWEVGSPIIFKGTFEDKSFEDKGNIVRMEDKKLLQYDYWSAFSGLPDKPENYSMVTYSLDEEDNKTKVTVTQEGFAHTDAKEHAEVSWKSVLHSLKELCEN